MAKIHSVVHLAVALADQVKGNPVVVACKLLWQNMWVYQTTTFNFCPHIDGVLKPALSIKSTDEKKRIAHHFINKNNAKMTIE
jgi:hypothetical protein